MFEIWISLGHIQIKLTVAYSLQTTSTNLTLSIFLPQTVNVKKRNRSMNSMGQYWLCCYNGKNCSVLMIA